MSKSGQANPLWGFIYQVTRGGGYMYKLNSTVHTAPLHRCCKLAAATVVVFEGVRLVSEYTTCIECQVTALHYCWPDRQ